MLFETSGQAYVFLVTIYVGVAAGLLYDITRALRAALGRTSAVRHVLDGLFWAVCGLLFAMALLRANDGHLRGYTLLGCAVGWLLYLLALSPYVRCLLNSVYKALTGQWQALMHTSLAKRLFK